LLIPANAMPGELAAMSPVAAAAWIASRALAAVLTVPIAEELAYRGYLLRRLVDNDFESVPFRSVRWPALLISAVVFGLAHGALWLPGIIAGLAYGGLLVRSGRIGEAVAAHAITNALIVAAVLFGQQWQLW
jgi:CAAX prenyl protease-like protein